MWTSCVFGQRRCHVSTEFLSIAAHDSYLPSILPFANRLLTPLPVIYCFLGAGRVATAIGQRVVPWAGKCISNCQRDPLSPHSSPALIDPQALAPRAGCCYSLLAPPLRSPATPLWLHSHRRVLNGMKPCKNAPQTCSLWLLPPCLGRPAPSCSLVCRGRK